MYIVRARSLHASAWPFSAALRQHCNDNRLLRVTPRYRALTMMLATSKDGTFSLKKRETEI
jgi:hypothetical protein